MMDFLLFYYSQVPGLFFLPPVFCFIDITSSSRLRYAGHRLELGRLEFSVCM